MNTDNLKEVRKKKGLTQKDVADALGLSPNTYKNYEQGMRSPDNEMLVKLASFYGVTTDYLLGRSDEKPDPIAMLTDDELEQELLNGYFNLPKDYQAAFRKMLEEAVERSEKRRRGISVSGNSEKAIARGNREYLDPPTPEQEAAAEDITNDDDI